MNNNAILYDAKILNEPSFKKEDVWIFREMGFSEEEIGSGNKKLNFKELEEPWLIDLVKDFMLFKSKRVKPSRLCGMLMAIKKYKKHLDMLLVESLMFEHFSNKNNVLDFFDNLAQHPMATISVVFSSLREFFLYFENIGLVDSYNKIIPLDIKPRHALKFDPRPIPIKSVQHLKEACKNNDTFIKRFLNINLEVGARANEILLLKDDSIHKTDVGWNLTRYESKSSRYITTPISDECAEVIQMQISLAKEARLEYQKKNKNYSQSDEYLKNEPYIFIHFYKNKFSRYVLRNIGYQIKNLIKEYGITDELGNTLEFTSHKLRHTVASNLVENGVNQVFVQRFLGHKTPMMTNFYAQISEKKMRLELKFDQVAEHDEMYNDIYGNNYNEITYDIDDDLDQDWLRKNISAHILPNGICALPIRQTCHHGNACLTCVSFRTGKQFKDKLLDQKERLIKIIDIAEEGGLRDQVQINTKSLTNLTKILDNINE